MARIDIRTAVVRQGQTFWAMHAGGGRKFATYFREESLLFLELAGVTLSEQILGDIERLRQHVRMGERIAGYHDARNAGVDAEEPSRDPSQYRSGPGRSDTGLNARVGNVHTLFVRVKKGDLVFVPITIGGVSYVLAGEVLEDFNPQTRARLDLYTGEFVPARRVKWIGQPIVRREIGDELSLRLSNRHAIIAIGPEFRKDAVSYVYRNVSIDGSSQSIINGAAYDGKRITDIIDAIDLLNRALFLTARVDDAGVVANFNEVQPLSRQEAAEIVETFALEFSSPGAFRLAAKGIARTSLLVALLLAFASDVSQSELANNTLITNSLAPSDREITPQVQEQLKGIMQILKPKDFKLLREEAKRSSDQIRLNVDGRVTP